MPENEPNSPQIGTFAAVRDYYVKAAAYDAGFHRHSDNLAFRDKWTAVIVASVTAVTSLGIFGSLFINNPATWAKVVVFGLSGVAAVLTAVRQATHWTSESELAKSAGDKWTEHRDEIRNLAARLCDGGKVTTAELDDVKSADLRLVAASPPIPNRLYDRFKRTNRQQFDRDYSLAGGQQDLPRKDTATKP